MKKSVGAWEDLLIWEAYTSTPNDDGHPFRVYVIGNKEINVYDLLNSKVRVLTYEIHDSGNENETEKEMSKDQAEKYLTKLAKEEVEKNRKDETYKIFEKGKDEPVATMDSLDDALYSLQTVYRNHIIRVYHKDAVVEEIKRDGKDGFIYLSELAEAVVPTDKEMNEAFKKVQKLKNVLKHFKSSRSELSGIQDKEVELILKEVQDLEKVMEKELIVEEQKLDKMQDDYSLRQIVSKTKAKS